MKKFLLAISLVALYQPAFAESDASIPFEIVSGLRLWNGSYSEMMLDINFETNTISVNGTITTPAGLSSPATGTCFASSTGGAYCNLQVDHLSLNLILDQNLSGTISVKGADGSTIDTKPVRLFRG